MQSNSDGKASPGSPFKPPAARIWNNMVDAGRAHADSLLNGGPPNPIRPRETDIIKAKNNSGALRRTGEILRISGKAIQTVTDENKWLLGVEPTDDGYFGILQEPAAISGIASLQVSGCCMALVNVTDGPLYRPVTMFCSIVKKVRLTCCLHQMEPVKSHVS